MSLAALRDDCEQAGISFRRRVTTFVVMSAHDESIFAAFQSRARGFGALRASAGGPANARTR